MDKRTFLAFLWCCITVPLSAQFTDASLRNDTLAMVDGHAVTTTDLFERISLMPFAEKTVDRDFHSVKRKAVLSLISEYLLGDASVALPPTEGREYYRAIVLQHMLIRDAMFQRDIRANVSVSEKEVLQSLHRYTSRRSMLVAAFSSDDEASRFVRSWNSGVLTADVKRDALLRSRQHDTLSISLGSVDSVLEDAAFRAKRPQEAVGPVRSSLFGTVAVVFLADEPNPAAAGRSAQERGKAVKDILQERKESQRQLRLAERLVSEQTMAADTALFFDLAKRLHMLMLRDTVERKGTVGFRFLSDDIDLLFADAATQLDSPIVRGTFGTIPLGIFLEHLYYMEYTFPSMRGRQFVQSFFNLVRTVTEMEMMAQEAERRGFGAAEDVKRQRSMWEQNRLALRTMRSVADTVSLADWEPYYLLWRQDPAKVQRSLQLRVREWILPDSVQAMAAVRPLTMGTTVPDTDLHTQFRQEWSASNGESPWFAAERYPEIAEAIIRLPLQNCTQPYRTGKGFAVSRLLGRRLGGDPDAADSALQTARIRLLDPLRRAAVDRVVAARAAGCMIEVRDDAIRSAQVPDVNMITRRTFGFGGRMNAAPMLSPQWEWYDRWRSVQKINP